MSKKIKKGEISLPLSNCDDCPLYCEQSYNPHNYWGDLDNCEVLFVGEAPGGQEKRIGKVFQGRAGKLLQKTIHEFGITNFALCNTVACRPENIDPISGQVKDRKPKKKEQKHCAENLDAIIQHTKPKAIVLLGTGSCERFKLKGGITKNHGRVINDETYGVKLLPMYHPAYIIRTPQYKEEFDYDFKTLKGILSGSYKTKKIKGNYTVLDNLADVRSFAEKAIEAKHYSFDVETTGNVFWKHHLLGIGFSLKPKTGVYIPLMVKKDDSLYEEPNVSSFDDDYYSYWGDEDEEVFRLIKMVLLAKKPKKIAHNIKFDTKMCEYHFNIRIPNLWMDTMLAHYILDENKKHGLKVVINQKYPEYRGYDEELDKYLTKKKEEESTFGDIPLPVLGRYCCIDCDLTLRLARDFYKELTPNLKRLLFHFYMPLTRVYADAEMRGTKIDVPYVKNTIKEYEIEEAKHLKEVFKVAGKEFNLNSTPQLQQVLYKELKLPVMGYTETSQPSTSEGVLKEIPKNSENIKIVNHILEYRGFNKALTTYLRPFIDKVDYNDRIHNDFLLHGTVTGRTSSKNPNLQNIPREKKIKGMFTADPNYYPVEIDFSQVELRVMSYYSQDPVLLKVYQEGGDVHLTTACFIFKKKPHEVTKWERKRAKLVNFGFIYGGCFPEFSKVLTNKGYKYIQDIKKGDKVINYKGEFEVEQLHKNGERLVKEYTFSDGSTLTCTPNHEIQSVLGFKSIGDIKIGEPVIKVYNTQVFGEDNKLPKVDLGNMKYKKVDWQPPKYMTQDLATFMGAWLSEGSVRLPQPLRRNFYHGLNICQGYTNKSDKFWDKIVEVSKNIFPEDHITLSDKDKYIRRKNTEGKKVIKKDLQGNPIPRSRTLYITSIIMCEWFMELMEKGNDRSHNKYIPDWIKNSPKEFQKTFLQAIFEGDGSISTRGGISYKSMSPRLLKDLQEMLTNWGIVSKIKKNRLQIITYHIDKFLLDIGFLYKKKHTAKNGKTKEYNLSIINDNHYMTRLVESKEIGVKKVYDLTVNEEPYYTVNHFSVHNSAKRALAGIKEKSGDEDDIPTIEEMQHFRREFFKLYKGVDQFIKKIHRFIQQYGYVENCFGRIRRLPQILSPDEDKQAEALREGLNAIIQSTASDITQLGAIKAHKMLRKKKAKSHFLLNVHDALIFEFHKDEIHLVGEVKELMELTPKPFNLPLIAEPEVFLKRWGWDNIEYNVHPKTINYRLKILREKQTKETI